VIRTFANAETEQLYFTHKTRRFNSIARAAIRKLEILYNARDLKDLQNPPGNRLELLRGDRAGQYSIRINDQFRICFRWIDGNADDVEIVDYH
jgi:toxin HigB-1